MKSCQSTIRSLQSQSTIRSLNKSRYRQVGTDIRLDNRVLDMRVPAQNAINRISSVPYP